MPWTPEDAPRHTRKASAPRLRRLWAEVANAILMETGDEARAVRTANGVVAREARRRGCCVDDNDRDGSKSSR